ACLISAYVNSSAHDSRKTALVGGRSVGVVAGVNPRAAAQQRVGKSGTAVVLQRAKVQVCCREIDLIIRVQRDRTVGRTKKVEAVGLEAAIRPGRGYELVGDVLSAAVGGENGVLGLNGSQ